MRPIFILYNSIFYLHNYKNLKKIIHLIYTIFHGLFAIDFRLDKVKLKLDTHYVAHLRQNRQSTNKILDIYFC